MIFGKKKRKLKLLFIDDSYIDLSLMKLQLQEYGKIDAIYARSVEEAKRVISGTPDLDAVLTDYELAGEERGRDVLKMSKDRVPSVPVFLMTSHCLDVKPELREHMCLDQYAKAFKKPYTEEGYVVIFDEISKIVKELSK